MYAIVETGGEAISGTAGRNRFVSRVFTKNRGMKFYWKRSFWFPTIR